MVVSDYISAQHCNTVRERLYKIYVVLASLSDEALLSI